MGKQETVSIFMLPVKYRTAQLITWLEDMIAFVPHIMYYEK
jgi:hypothetical protein